MARYERQSKGHFEEFLDSLHNDITHDSVSASHEDGRLVSVC